MQLRIKPDSAGESELTSSLAWRPQFCANLLAWYDAHARDLPWRRTQDPYRIWLSEIMLQQTRVAAVIEHYHEFLRRFPTVQKLAAAREASVLAAWSGLGYYRRARMMHKAARMIARKRGGKFPSVSDELRNLPGIGRYTAAAIASIAFDEPVAVVDGNVERVLQRISGTWLSKESLWKTAGGLIDSSRPGDFNQAMMELGAVICTPRAPACLTCPVIDFCATRGRLDGSAKTPVQKKREVHYALMEKQTRESGKEVFLTQRPANAPLMGGMWELPSANEERKGDALLKLKHSITVTNYTVHVWRAMAATGQPGKWFGAGRLKALPLTGLARKILRKSGFLS